MAQPSSRSVRRQRPEKAASAERGNLYDEVSAFLYASLGIVPTVRHADYLAHWLEMLREDSRAIFRAASQASKAADWILARHAEATAQDTRNVESAAA